MSTQISVHISDETRRQIEHLVRRRGITKARLIHDPRKSS
jgi:predicted DNA-binding protein